MWSIRARVYVRCPRAHENIPMHYRRLRQVLTDAFLHDYIITTIKLLSSAYIVNGSGFIKTCIASFDVAKCQQMFPFSLCHLSALSYFLRSGRSRIYSRWPCICMQRWRFALVRLCHGPKRACAEMRNSSQIGLSLACFWCWSRNRFDWGWGAGVIVNFLALGTRSFGSRRTLLISSKWLWAA